jgi:hypothetical protein
LFQQKTPRSYQPQQQEPVSGPVSLKDLF